MKVFVTGASGWIGSAAVAELVAAGHDVVGLARSDASAEHVAELGAEVLRGSIDQPDGLRETAAGVDAVVHLAYHHDFSQMAEAAELDRGVIAAVGEALPEGGTLLIASGTLGLATGRPGTEEDRPEPSGHPRLANADLALSLADRGLHPVVARFAPTVHGAGDHGFTARLVEIARESGVSAYVGDGANRWPAVHRLDAGELVRRAVEDPTMPIVHAIAEEGVAARDIATAIGEGLGLPVEPRPAEHFGWLGAFFAADIPASSDLTRERLGWEPSRAGLIADLEAGSYF
ncbi:SDR family oxidoreductase [Nocardioides mangrovicus]|uniref:SDR family oxidoreductase n=1 Tax=Nocardioides mangrovicus TaxID=2478913 RepID=A0A3L8P5P1_9ACTN|nr:SDR family oxidoreductase [Nocardioides mangrovicus]RLV50726.1 SDR family oxidoreductase [Nocardioides mangrovicus]